MAATGTCHPAPKLRSVQKRHKLSGAFFKPNPRLATPDIHIHFLPFSTDKMGE